MHIADAPPRIELVRRASELVPLLKKNALWSEENRRVHPESIEALTDAGLLKMRAPLRYGGYESDMTTVVDVLGELARGDGSAAWTAAVWAISTWMVGLFPDEVQDEIFAEENVRVSGILSPTAVGVATEGGIVVNGKWSFNTGATQSKWNTNAAVIAHPNGEYEPIMVAIPISELEIVDDWHTAGLRGSGSVTTIAKDLFVPNARVLPMVPVLQGRHLSKANADSPLYRTPFMPTACTTVSAVPAGLARAAKDAFFERLPGRKITYTNYASQNDAPITHFQVAEATIKIDEAGYHVHAAAHMLDDKSARNEEWTLRDRATARLHMGAVCQRAKEAVDVLNTASGGSSVYTSVPIQRIERDVQTVNLHAIMHPNNNLELYGRVACGLEPNTNFI
jgi:3-hydroxy-9,10-secoandrosta-1,3,5(10)-triene-9,17-dione monooxygenase